MRPILFLLLLCLISCNDRQPTASQVPADPRLPSAQQVRERMDDAGNPYLGSYKKWDYLLAETVVQVTERPDPSISRDSSDVSPGNRLLEGMLDERGFLLPRAKLLRLKEQHTSRATNIGKPFGESNQWVYALTPVPPDIFDALQRERDKVALEFLPTYPDWLSDKDFFAATVLPNGQVVLDLQHLHPKETVPLGDAPSLLIGGGDGHHTSHASRTTYELYSSTGDLLASTNELQWWPLFGNSAPTDVTWDHCEFTPDGYWVLSDSSINSIVATLDYDGTRLSKSSALPRDPHDYAAIRKSRALRYSRAE